MTDTDSQIIDQARRQHLRAMLADLDFLRLIAQIDTTTDRRRTARQLVMSEPELDDRIRQAATIAPIAEGFSGAGPLEIAKRYTADLLSRDEVIDELSRWEFATRPQTDGIDWLTVDVPGSVEELEEAESAGYIDMSIYKSVDANLRSRGVCRGARRSYRHGAGYVPDRQRFGGRCSDHAGETAEQVRAHSRSSAAYVPARASRYSQELDPLADGREEGCNYCAGEPCTAYGVRPLFLW